MTLAGIVTLGAEKVGAIPIPIPIQHRLLPTTKNHWCLISSCGCGCRL